MDKKVNRVICLAQWKNGEYSFTMSRFVWKNGVFKKHHYFFVNKLTMTSIKRIDKMFNNYKGEGIIFSKNEERVMITQRWDDVHMMDGEVVDRGKFKTFEDMVKEWYPYLMIDGVCHVR